MKAELIGLLLVGILVISGCAGEQKGGGDGVVGETEKIENSLPTVSGWAMTKLDTESPEGIQVLKGAYEKGSSIVVLSVVNGNSENVVKNQILSMAHEAMEESAVGEAGLVGPFVANYITDNKFHAIYANSGKTGFVAVAESMDSLNSFLSASYGQLVFDT